MRDGPWVHSGTPRRRGQALVTQLEASWCRRCAGHQELLSVREARPWSWLSRVCTGDSGQVRGTAEEAQGAPRGRRQAFCGVSCASSRGCGWTGEACLRLGAGRLGAPWSLRVSVRGCGGPGEPGLLVDKPVGPVAVSAPRGGQGSGTWEKGLSTGLGRGRS